MTDLDARAAVLDDYLADAGLDAVWFARPDAFAWLTGGSNVVDREGAVGVAAAGYVPDGDDPFRAVTTNAEADRLAAEELPDAFAVSSIPWYEGWVPDAVAEASPANAAADVDVPGLATVDPAPLRLELTDDDAERYRRLGEETAAAVETVCRELEAGDTEHEVAAALRIALAAREIEAPVVLVGGSERAGKYRHCTPTDAALGDYCLVSVTAARGGLHASVTRTVAFDAPEWLAARHRAAARVEATALAATRAVAAEDGVAGDVFDEVQGAYDAVGFPEEWREHHQGGATGFAGREWVATPDSTARVTTPTAYAWNPTVQGAKSEDTYLVTDEGFEVLTAVRPRATGAPRWPTVEVAAVDRDATFERHGVLHR